jgi:hypothetical protein
VVVVFAVVTVTIVVAYGVVRRRGGASSFDRIGTSVDDDTAALDG